MIDKVMTQTRTTELDTITTRIYTTYQNNSHRKDNNLTKIFNEMKPLSISISEAIKRIKSESSLDEKDELRNNAARSFNYMILGYIHNPDEIIKNAASKIMFVFENYGMQIITESYATETSLLNSLLVDLAKPELQEYIALLPGLAECIATLKATQSDFEASQLEYEQNKAEEGTYQNATSLKKQILEIINKKLVIYLKAMSIVDEANYGNLTRTIAQIIADNNETVKKRSKKIAHK